MVVYLINKDNLSVVQEFNNVIDWGMDFVEYINGQRCKFYCLGNEYFTNIKPSL